MNQNAQAESKKRVSFVDIYNRVGIYLILVIFIIISQILNHNFLTLTNVLNLLRQNTPVALIACGITLLIITGNTDLSAGSMVALSGCFVLGTFKNLTKALGWGTVPTAIIAIIASTLLCLVLYGASSLIITYMRAPAFIVTLAINTAARGLALMYTKGKIIKQAGKIVKIGQDKVGGVVPYQIFFLVIFLVITWILLTQMRFGKYIYAIGGNPEAARAAGINNNSVIIRAYLYHAVCVSFAGLLFMSRLDSGQPAEAVGLEFDAITAAIIGGASLAGGQGAITGTFAGVLIIGILKNILTLMRVQSYYQQIITGIIIVLAVVIDIKTKGGKKN